MEANRPSKRIFQHFNKSNNFSCKRIQESKEDLQEMTITERYILDRNGFKSKVRSFTEIIEKEKKKTGSTWLEARKKEHSNRMGEYWRKKKRRSN